MKATTPCPYCYHTDDDHEQILKARQWAKEFHDRHEARMAQQRAEEAAKAYPRFVCRCGHPGLGCTCR